MRDNEDGSITFDACGYSTIAKVEFTDSTRRVMLEQAPFVGDVPDVVVLGWDAFEALYNKLRIH